jgi:hypothetical protein
MERHLRRSAIKRQVMFDGAWRHRAKSGGLPPAAIRANLSRCHKIGRPTAGYPALAPHVAAHARVPEGDAASAT